MITLSDDQAIAKDEVKKFLAGKHPRAKDELTIGGYAGTGKTTLINSLKEELQEFAEAEYATFTGKAAHVLRSKGVQAQTIHSLIYEWDEEDGRFYLDGRLLKNPMPLVVIDEASMVNRKIVEDLRKVSVRIVWVGDHGQLQPIGDDPKILREPIIRLEKIMRQANDDPMLRFAHQLREGVAPYDTGYPVKPLSEVYGEENWKGQEVVICGTNATRHKFNLLRQAEIHGEWVFETPVVLPYKGDTVICLQNNHEIGIFNGQTAKVLEAYEVTDWSLIMDIELDSGTSHARVIRELDVSRACFGKNKTRDNSSRAFGELFDIGYAITCHKAQGAEYDGGIVVDECFRFTRRDKSFESERWRYTAATRFKNPVAYFA